MDSEYRIKATCFIICLIITLSMGCMERHYIEINPYVPITSHNFNHSKPIGLKVTNNRPSNNIAREFGPDFIFFSPKFTVRSKSDLTEIIREKISEGLFRMGFDPKRLEKVPNKTFRVEIVRLKTKYEEKLPGFNVRVQAALRGHCVNRRKSYAKTYSYEKQFNSAPASTFPNENLINDTLSETLKKMFEDENLIFCLVQ